MSNYLITLKLNELQTQVNTLKEVDGLTNPLVPEVEFDVNANDIINVGIMSCTEINASGTITCETLDASTLAITNIITSGTITAGTLVSTGEVKGETGDFSTNLRATSITQYTGGFNQVSISGGGVNCLTVNTDNLASNSATPIQVQAGAQFQVGLTVNNEENISCSTTGGKYSISDVGTMSCDEINAAGTITCTALDASTLQIPIINTGTLTAGTVVSTGGAQFQAGLTVNDGQNIKCSTIGDRYTISDVEIDNANYLALTNQNAGLNLSIQSQVVDTKSMLTVCTVGGSNYGKIYDSYYNPPPSVEATSLAGILATSSDAGGGNITNLANLTATSTVTSNALSVTTKSSIAAVGLPTINTGGNSSNFVVLKANTNPAIGPVCPAFGYIAGSNPDPSLPLSYSCLNDNTVNPALAIIRVTNTTSPAISLTFTRTTISSPFYLALIFGYTLPSSSYFNTIELSYNSLTFNSTTSSSGVVKLNIVPVITNSAAEFDTNTTNAHAFHLQLPQSTTGPWTISNSNNVLLTNYILPVVSPKVYLAAYIDAVDSALPPGNTFPFTSIILDNAVITLSNSRLTDNPPVSFSPAIQP